MTDFDDRRRGCLLGLAVGDALGAAVEFRPPGTFEPVARYRAGGPHERLAVLAPERVVRRGADRGGLACDRQVQNAGVAVPERAGHDPHARPGRHVGARLDGQHLGQPLDAALRHDHRDAARHQRSRVEVPLRRQARGRRLFLQPPERPQQRDVRPGAVPLLRPQPQQPPGGRIDRGPEVAVRRLAEIAGRWQRLTDPHRTAWHRHGRWLGVRHRANHRRPP